MPVKNNNLTPARRAHIKQDVLDELDKINSVVKKHKTRTDGFKKNVRPLSAPQDTMPTARTIAPKSSITPLATELKQVSSMGDKNFSLLPAAVRKTTILSVGALLLAFLLAIALDVWGLYRWKFNDPLSYAVAGIFRLPAGEVAGQKISLADYLADLRVLKFALAHNREGLGGDLTAAKDKDLENNLFYRLAAMALVDKELARRRQNVSEEEIKNSLDKLVAQLGGRQPAESAVKKLYDLNLSQFGDKVLKFLIARDKLQEAIAQDQALEINKKAKSLAEQVLRLALAKGADFETLAEQFTQDEAGINIGGDLGWLTRGEVAPELEAIIFSLPNETVYGQLIKNRLGYHIVKVEKKLANPEDGKESVKARHILIRVDIDEYIRELLNQAQIKKYVK